MLYDNGSLYRRSYANIPEHLNLEEVDTNGELSPLELKHLVKKCPNVKSLRFKYFRDNPNDEQDNHLAKLSQLNFLTHLSISSANFYEHHLFQLMEIRGDQVSSMCIIIMRT